MQKPYVLKWSFYLFWDDVVQNNSCLLNRNCLQLMITLHLMKKIKNKSKNKTNQTVLNTFGIRAKNNSMKEDHRSYRSNVCSCEKKAWKKIRLVRDSNPSPLRYYWCSALSIELTSQLGAGRFNKILHPAVLMYDFHMFITSRTILSNCYPHMSRRLKGITARSLYTQQKIDLHSAAIDSLQLRHLNGILTWLYLLLIDRMKLEVSGS